MKLLVLSDSHSTISFMRRCVETVKPSHMIHLGDHYDDGQVLAEENPGILFYQVPGNCDRYRCPISAQEILNISLGGVRVYATHGHIHKVKLTLGLLLKDARAVGAGLVLYGHTHAPDYHREEDGTWVLNPGSSGYYGGSAGLVELENGQILSCRILKEEDL